MMRLIKKAGRKARYYFDKVWIRLFFLNKNIFPASRLFGFDRGKPIDRYYIEKFLSEHHTSIRGNVLEVSEDTYSKMFGSQIQRIDILHVSNENNRATIIGDLTQTITLPEDSFNCFICTQTLNFIYDFKKAIEGIKHLLKPGGTALITVAGICQVSKYDEERWGDFWRFCPNGIEKSFQEVFGKDQVNVFVYGNCEAAVSLLQGLAVNEKQKRFLDRADSEYPVTIGIVAKKIN